MHTYNDREIVARLTEDASCEGCIGTIERGACKQLPLCTAKWNRSEMESGKVDENFKPIMVPKFPGNARIWVYKEGV